MYITICEIDDQSKFNETGHLKPVHRDNPEVWEGDRGGRRVQEGDHMYTCGKKFLKKKEKEEERKTS